MQCTAIPQADTATLALCPNPFCRTELPNRRDEMSLRYELYGVSSPATDSALE